MAEEVCPNLGPLWGGKCVGYLAGGIVFFFDIEVYDYTIILVLI